MTFRVRPAGPDDLPRLRHIEAEAGRMFRDLGMDAIADDEPPPLDVLADYQQAGRCWVAAVESDGPVAYAIVDLVDGGAHIEQVTVHPDWARRRLGATLLAAVQTWAAARGLSSLTLTTFSTVPWNRPYYERLGFLVVEVDDQSPALRRIREEEAARGLDSWPRVAMRRDLAPFVLPR